MILGIDMGKRMGLALVFPCGDSRQGQVRGSALAEGDELEFSGLAVRLKSVRTDHAISEVWIETMEITGRESRKGLVTTARLHERLRCALILAGYEGDQINYVSVATWRAKMLKGVPQKTGGTSAQRAKAKKDAARAALPQWLANPPTEWLAACRHDEIEAILIACYARELRIHQQKKARTV